MAERGMTLCCCDQQKFPVPRDLFSNGKPIRDRNTLANFLTSLDIAKRDFFVDNAERLPQYLGCKQPTILLVGLLRLNRPRNSILKEALTNGDQEKSGQEKEEKVAGSGAKSPFESSKGK